MKPVITICTVNYNSSDFIELMLYAFEKLTKRPYKVIIRDNDSSKRDYKQLEEKVKQFSNVSVYRVETELRSSEAHGTALNDLVTKIDTPYGVIMDADATFLCKNWDDVLFGLLSKECPIVGTQADTLGGKPKDFPLMFALLFKTDVLKELKVDFRPKDINRFQDTGWEIREKYLAAGYKGKMIYDFNTRIHKDTPFFNLVCACYFERPDKKNRGRLIASHFGRGSAPKAKNLVRFGKNKNGVVIKVFNKCLSVFNVMKWGLDRRKWLKVCKRIINN